MFFSETIDFANLKKTKLKVNIKNIFENKISQISLIFLFHL